MKRILLVVSLVACSGFFNVSRGQTAIDPAKAQNIRRLMELTGSHNLVHQVIEQMMESIRREMPVGDPELSDKIFNIYKEEFHKAFTVEKLNGHIIPIYDKHFTGDEVLALIAFYESPVGKKMISALPRILAEVSVVGENLGREVQVSASKRIETEVSPSHKSVPQTRPAARRRPGRRPRT